MKLTGLLSLLLLYTSIMVPTVGAQTNLVTLEQNGDEITLNVTKPSNFSLKKLILQVTGPEQTPPEYVLWCKDGPFFCTKEFPVVPNASVVQATFETSHFITGSYNWQLELVPDTSNSASDCQYTFEEIRELSGGEQGLYLPLVAEFFACLDSNNILPPSDQEVIEIGSFAITESAGLVTPVDPSDPAGQDNQPPVALCQDITVVSDSADCLASANVDSGSYDPEGGTLTYSQAPPSPYTFGAHNVTLTAVDDFGLSATCQAVVTVLDETAPEAISCNSPAIIIPPDAPISFVATSSDTCGATSTTVVFYDCYKFTKKGKRIDKKDSCVVHLSGDTVTIADSGGVGTFIDWTVIATDQSGNSIETQCGLQIANPGQGNN